MRNTCGEPGPLEEARSGGTWPTGRASIGIWFRTVPYRRDHPRHPSGPSLTAELGMHPGMADAAEGDEVWRVVVRGIEVEVMDMEVPHRSADRAYLAVTIDDDGPDLPPAPEPVLRPCTDGDAELIAEDGPLLPDRERAPAAEADETVVVREAVAEGGPGAVERIKTELQVRGHP